MWSDQLLALIMNTYCIYVCYCNMHECARDEHMYIILLVSSLRELHKNYMIHKWLIQPWEASNSLLGRELVQKCRTVYVRYVSKSLQFGYVPFCLKEGKQKEAFL